MIGVDKNVTCLVVWVLWHIDHSRLFKAKSIFMQIILFKQFSLARVHGLIMKNISISGYSVYLNSSNTANSV